MSVFRRQGSQSILCRPRFDLTPHKFIQLPDAIYISLDLFGSFEPQGKQML